MSVRQYEEERQERERKLKEENKRLTNALESIQEELISIRGVNKTHDGEITGLCIEIRKVLNGCDYGE